ncbi:MAG: hypothetical protein IH847_08795 [Acidobacteria bacterium]|nr:hypothetical protein [Acidobacteriota bacterium]
MKKPAEKMTVERAREVLGAFLDEFYRLFEPTEEEIEAMRTLLRAS